jgi:hypothetical protein
MIGDNPVQDDWENTLEHTLDGNFLMDTPRGKSAYAAGIAYALVRLERHVKKAAWNQLREEATEWCQTWTTDKFS